MRSCLPSASIAPHLSHLPILLPPGPLIIDAERLVKDRMADYDPSHDWLHVDRVRRTALALARSLDMDSLDILVVELAALFHDLTDGSSSSSTPTTSTS